MLVKIVSYQGEVELWQLNFYLVVKCIQPPTISEKPQKVLIIWGASQAFSKALRLQRSTVRDTIYTN